MKILKVSALMALSGILFLTAYSLCGKPNVIDWFVVIFCITFGNMVLTEFFVVLYDAQREI